MAARDAGNARNMWRVSRVYWLVVLYCVVWTLVRNAGWDGAEPIAPSVRLPLTITFIIAVTGLALRTRVALQRGGYGRAHPHRIGWIFTVVDLTAVSAGLRLTGGLSSGLWPILFLIVVAESVLEPTREAWFVRIGAFAALLAAATPIPFHGGPWLLDAATRMIFLIAVASVARRLREGAEREKSELAALRAELDLSDQRARLSREVHDGVGNSLAASVLRLEVAARIHEKSEPSPENVAALLREEAQSLRQAMGQVRDWTFWTRPWSIRGTSAPDGIGPNVTTERLPSEILSDEIERLSHRVSLPVHLKGAELLDALGSRAETLRLTLLRIAQEALTNAAKHATGAQNVWVTLDRDDNAIVLEVRDDGPGFEGTGSGIGMTSMRERALGAGGTLTVAAASGEGVVVTARLPIP